MSDIGDWTNQIHQGDAKEVLAEMPANSVHAAVCSPPYWGMRDYGSEGQIGLEGSFSDFVTNLGEVGDELRRVVRDDGSWWLNVGDGYGGQETDSDASVEPDGEPVSEYSTLGDDYSSKSKLLMPHRACMELVERGWIARNDAVWKKTNPMPESVKDRLSTTFEMVFHLVQQRHYYYDLDAIREPYETDLDEEPPIGGKKHQDNVNNTYSGNTPERTGKGKNPGDVFELPTDTSSEGHFAVYPPELVVKPIKATCPPVVCAECGDPYEPEDGERRQSCDCETDETEPGVVLDPFAGRGTTCKVAAEHGRRYVGIELNPEYAELARDFVPESRQQTFSGYQTDE